MTADWWGLGSQHSRNIAKTYALSAAVTIIYPGEAQKPTKQGSKRSPHSKLQQLGCGHSCDSGNALCPAGPDHNRFA
jgi:hypothetical protein